jgi:hypothetical protein
MVTIRNVIKLVVLKILKMHSVRVRSRVLTLILSFTKIGKLVSKALSGSILTEKILYRPITE